MAQPRRCWALPRRWWALDRPPPLCGERPQSDLELSGLVVCTVSAACRPSPVAWTRRARVQGVRSRAASHPRLGEELSHKDVQQVSGISSASLTPTPQLFQACDESYSGFEDDVLKGKAASLTASMLALQVIFLGLGTGLGRAEVEISQEGGHGPSLYD